MKDFNYWNALYRNEVLAEFSNDRTGLLWLKTKSIIRKQLIEAFTQQNGIFLKQSGLNQQFAELFGLLSEDIDQSHKQTPSCWQNGCMKIKEKCDLVLKIVCFLCLLIQKILIILGN